MQGQWFSVQNSGQPAPSVELHANFEDGVLEISAGGRPFRFVGVDYSGTYPVQHISFDGFRNGAHVYNDFFPVGATQGRFLSFGSVFASVPIETLRLGVGGVGPFGIDNIILAF